MSKRGNPRLIGKSRSTVKSDVRYSGFIVGISCAIIGSALFAIVETVLLAMKRNSLSFDLSLILTLLFFGSIFSSIPAGFGGTALGLLLKNQKQKGSLTPSIAAKTGMLLGGLAAIITCMMGILFLMLAPHNNWYIFLDDVRKGTFFEHISNYLYFDLEWVSRLWPEILTAITIACLAGGWAGRNLAKQLQSAEQ